MNHDMVLISKALKPLAEGIDESITRLVGHHIGFCLVVFTEGRAQYVSNCDRQEVAAALRELLTRWEQGMPDIKAHEVS
jgi:hypothetical protein